MLVDFPGGKLPQPETEHKEGNYENRSHNRGNSGGKEYRVEDAMGENRGEEYQKTVLLRRLGIEFREGIVVAHQDAETEMSRH